MGVGLYNLWDFSVKTEVFKGKGNRLQALR